MCYLVFLPFRINNKKNFDFMNKVWLNKNKNSTKCNLYKKMIK